MNKATSFGRNHLGDSYFRCKNIKTAKSVFIRVKRIIKYFNIRLTNHCNYQEFMIQIYREHV